MKCSICGREPVSKIFPYCAECIRRGGEEIKKKAIEVHKKIRDLFNLPGSPPKSGIISCKLCSNECIIGEGERGFCGLRKVTHGRLSHLGGTPQRGILDWYYDPLPTNCVADPFCSGHTKLGYKNLAVFYRSCTMDCLFCQNWHFRDTDLEHHPGMTAEELANYADDETYCICFFGGDPSSQWLHALKVARILEKRGVTICFETNGTVNYALLEAALELSLKTMGTIKFDLKCFNENISYALSGVSNRNVLENFERAGEWFKRRPDPPLIVASTLLVPGYIDEKEIEDISNFIASIDKRIPYVLLAFYPHFMMRDLPLTQREFAYRALEIAKKSGLTRVRIGNIHLLT